LKVGGTGAAKAGKLIVIIAAQPVKIALILIVLLSIQLILLIVVA
jgi:hypothetical protein